jgi:general L-amino acid transport system permease protein
LTYRRKALLWQAMAALAVIALLVAMGHNAIVNMAQRNITFGFAFLGSHAGFDIPFRLIPWELTDSYARALLVAGINTLFAAALCIVIASALGLTLALMRLSSNLLAAGTARALVEIIRNTPQLLQIVFFYFAVLQVLPGLRQSVSIGGAAFLNVRGLFVPAPTTGPWDIILLATVLGVLVLALLWRRLGLLVPRLVVLPPIALACVVAAGFTAGWDFPTLKGFNFVGGVRLPPELLALTLGISVYTSAFISEVVRAAVLGIHKGQTEAARSLGLTGGQTMTLVILPQALRIVIPPLTSQYLNVIKSTTLGAAIAYPEVLQIFARTVLNQSGRAVEVMTIVLGVFLTFNLLTSWAMNHWNRYLELQGR